MQTKLTFYVYNKIGNIENSFVNSMKYIDDSTDSNLGDFVATFNEYSRIGLKFESEDKDAIIEIDTSLFEKAYEAGPSDEIITLSMSGDHDDMLTPGFYSIKISTSNKIYKGLYFINSQSISWDGLVNLRKYLEKTVYGLSQNLYIQRMAEQKNIYGDEEYSINKMYIFIQNNIDNVINSIESITKIPLTDIKKEYRERYYTKRQDAKSQRWLCTKGLNKNNNIYIPNVVFEKYSSLNKDIPENQYIKKIIQSNLETIMYILNGYRLIYQKSKVTIKNKVDLYELDKIALQRLNKDRIVTDKHKFFKKGELKYLKIDIEKLQEHSTFIAEIIMKLSKIKAMLLHYINETWLNDISYSGKVVKLSQKILKDNRYFQIYDFYLNILAIEKNDPESKKPNFPSKKTSKLFEYYSVSLVISILRNNDFKWHSGWLADNADDELFNGEIPTNIPIIFTKNDLRIELVYEKEVENHITVMDNNVSDFVRYGNHYKPDIMLNLFNIESDELLKSIVIEVKCCMSKNLQSKNGPSRAMEQVRDYVNFGYYDKKKKGRIKTRYGKVEKVIIIYPNQSKIVEYQYDDIDLTFIQVEANDASDTSKHYGYEELKNEIDACFSISSDDV